MTTDIYDLPCPFCGKHYKLPLSKVIKHAGKAIHCRACGKLFVVPAPTIDEPASEPAVVAPEPQLDAAAPEPVADEASAPEPPTTEPPATESVAQTAVTVVESFEPPPLSEYSETSAENSPVETPSEASAEDFAEHAEQHVESFARHEWESPAGKTNAASDFGSESVEHDPVAAEDEPPPSSETEEEEPAHVESPPPQLPPVPVSAPALPKPRRGARASVTPVFAPAEEEEPQPRRRGRFGMRSQADQIESVAKPVDESVEIQPEPAMQSPPLLDLGTVDPSAVEPEPVETVPHDEKEDEADASDTGNPIDNLPEIGESIPQAPRREDPPILASTRAPTTAMTGPAVSTQTGEDVAAIRRAVALLATMSVIIAVVLVAILLTLMGILPKK